MLNEALTAATQRLAAISATPRLDAELLLAHALGISREDILLGRHAGPLPAAFDALVARRVAGEPIAYITGTRAFWTIELAVAPGVLIPRPDTETLIDAAVAHFRGRSPRRILDLGTGSGALLLAALDEWPEATGLGIDRSDDALAIAVANAERLELATRAAFRLGNWADEVSERFDLVLCNPPYVEADAALPRDVAEHEPHSALFAGTDGLDDYRRLAPGFARLLQSGGMAAIELGAGQFSRVAPLFAGQGLTISLRQDLAGHERCLLLVAGLESET
ncbi:release factor glutamine methyltransferase [Sphingomonas zeicaulis]